MSDFFEELQKLCKLHDANIYRGLISEDDEPSSDGIVVRVKDAYYALEEVDERNLEYISID